MKKSFLFVIILLSCLSTNAQEETDTLVSIVKMNFEGLKGTDYDDRVFFTFEERTGATTEAVDDGIAITNPQMQDEIWEPQLNILEGFSLEEGHDYIVRLKLKVPSDGTYQLCMGDWSNNFVKQLAVKVQEGFQIIDVEYPEYGANIVGGAHILLGCGWVVGTTILQEVEVFEKLGYWTNMGFVELTPDESIVYKYVRAMDTHSQKAVNDLYASLKNTGDKSLIRCNETGGGGWYVKKDYPLPEGNYFESDFYNSNSEAYANELYVILPQVQSSLNSRGRIEDLLEYLGDRVTVDLVKETVIEDNKTTDFRFISNLKTSEEWLKLCLDVYNYGFDGLHYFVPMFFTIDKSYYSHLISIMTESNEDENLVYSMNWEGVEYPQEPVCFPDESIPDSYKFEGTDDGLAITVFQELEQVWLPQLIIVPDGSFGPQANHDYIIRLTIKVPSDGVYQLNMGSCTTNSLCQVPVTASDDFQVIDIELPSFDNELVQIYNKEGFHVRLQCGWVVGTSVLKKVEAFKKKKSGTTAIKRVTTTTPDDTIYNLAGQRVDASYKGIVIQNGRKVVK